MLNFIILAVFFISAIFHTLAGFGFPLISTSVLFTILPPKTAIILTLIPTFFMNVASIYTFVKFKEIIEIFKKYAVLFIFSAFGSYIGSHILIAFPSGIYKLLLSVSVLIYLNKDKFYINFGDFVQRHFQFSLFVFGLISGIIGGLINAMVIVLAILILELNLSKGMAIAVMNLCFLTNKISQISTFAAFGEFGSKEILFGAISVAVCFAALFITNKFKDRVSDELFKKLVKLTLIFFAIFILVQYFLEILKWL
ncbi:sulfite exporter TauE/SafE family protein [Campylobacter hominis]|uniref:Probable membrane transporter protein n=2 Tax=Campylobacter hominis TaxID=76517 RepID=A7I381_CAMHC|nr:sulfite exporter TauE/SafE family protein [Campylobacter hominis]ABS51772.1 putative domain of unknown function [Campylobacter hominis ATCC BAA-381]UAK85804.1 sulfite exporter TauE/SafE family protein [Campylobacter hominis]SUW85478.1 Sulfite exporter TauE/SafE [Campylobacter hominis]